MKRFFRFAAVLGWAIVLVFALSDSSYRKPGPFNIQIGDFIHTSGSSLYDRTANRRLCFSTEDSSSSFYISPELQAVYWGNTVTYIYSDTYKVKGYAIFTLSGKLLKFRQTPIFDSDYYQSVFHEFGKAAITGLFKLNLTNSNILHEHFPLTFRQIYDHYGSYSVRGNNADFNAYYYVLDDGRLLVLYRVSEPTYLAFENPDKLLLDIDSIWDPYLCTKTVSRYNYVSNEYEGTHPIFKPNTEWACSSYNAYYRTNSIYDDWGQGHLTINGKTISFQLLSALGGWKCASFVPLDEAGNLTHWEFQGILQKTLHGFDLIIPDSNGFFDNDPITLSFTEIA